MRIDEVTAFRGSNSVPKRIVGGAIDDVYCSPEDDLSGMEFISCDMRKLHMSPEQFASIKSVQGSIVPPIQFTGKENLRHMDIDRADLSHTQGLTLEQLWFVPKGLLTAKLPADLHRQRMEDPEIQEVMNDIYTNNLTPEEALAKMDAHGCYEREQLKA